MSVYAGDHDVFRRSRQISPVLKSTFGWQIGVVKVILGGASGYEGGMRMSRRQSPAGEGGGSVGGAGVGRRGEERITFVGGAGKALHDGFPVQDFGFGGGAEGLQDWGGVFDDGFELLEEAFGGGRGGGARGGHGASDGFSVAEVGV